MKKWMLQNQKIGDYLKNKISKEASKLKREKQSFHPKTTLQQLPFMT